MSVLVRCAILVCLVLTTAQAQTAPDAGQLARAAAVGNRMELLRLLNSGADVDAVAADGATALLTAAVHHQPATVAALLLFGANLEAKNAEGRTPLLAALCTAPGADEKPTAKPDTVSVLLTWNASLDAKASNGETAFTCPAGVAPDAAAERVADAVAERAALARSEEKAKLYKAGDGAPDLRFNLLLKAFGRDQEDDYIRGLIFAAARQLPKARPIPAEAKRVHDSGMTDLEDSHDHDQLERPIAELRRAVELAPWWGEAYRDLALALDKNGQYEWASEQMQHYLESQPPADELPKARALLIEMEAQWDALSRSSK
jgi:hypothetical protein